MEPVKVIEGRIRDNGALERTTTFFDPGEPPNYAFTCATLVVFSGPRQKLYTQQEVEALLQEIHAERSELWVDDGSGGTYMAEPTVFVHEIKAIAAKHGLNTTDNGK